MTPEQLENIKKILPSKKFTRVIVFCTLGVLIFLVATSFFSSRDIFTRTKPAIPLEEGDTLGDVMGKDTNKNGITDWEESLWGLDPVGDGPTNKKIIDDKKLAAGITPSTEDTSTETLTPTDQFAQEFLASILALHQSGSLTTDAVAQVAESVGKNIDAKRVVKPAYTTTDQHIVTENLVKAKNAYKISLKKLTDSYPNLGVGAELAILGDNIASGDENSLTPLEPIATAYAEFAKKLISIPVPKDASVYALSLANASAQMGSGLHGASTIYSDVLTGMVGVDDYIKASDIFDQAVTNLSLYFSS
jgi:hypothetical protein